MLGIVPEELIFVLQLLAGLAGVVFVTVCVTKLCLELSDDPVISDEEYEIVRDLGEAGGTDR